MIKWAVRLWRRYKGFCLECGGGIMWKPVWSAPPGWRPSTKPSLGVYFWCDSCKPDEYGLLVRADEKLTRLSVKEW